MVVVGPVVRVVHPRMAMMVHPLALLLVVGVVVVSYCWPDDVDSYFSANEMVGKAYRPGTMLSEYQPTSIMRTVYIMSMRFGFM